MQPSDALKAYFKAGDEDITPAIVERVETLSGNIFPAIQGPSGVGCMQTSLAKERKLEVGKSGCSLDIGPSFALESTYYTAHILDVLTESFDTHVWEDFIARGCLQRELYSTLLHFGRLNTAASYKVLHQAWKLRNIFLQGIKLYYRVLENMLKAEEARSGKNNFTALLENEIFHKCLLACSFEMIVASYRMVISNCTSSADNLSTAFVQGCLCWCLSIFYQQFYLHRFLGKMSLSKR